MVDEEVIADSSHDLGKYSSFISKYDLPDDLTTIVSDNNAIKLLSAYLKLVKENHIARLPSFLIHGQSSVELLSLCKATANSAESNVNIISILTLYEIIAKEFESGNTDSSSILELMIKILEREFTRIFEIKDHQEEYSTIIFEDLDIFLIVSKNDQNFNQLTSLSFIKQLDKLIKKLIAEYDHLLVFFTTRSNNLNCKLVNNQALISSFIENLSIGELIGINPPDDVLRSQIITERLLTIYNAEAILPSAEHISNLTDGFSFSKLSHILDIITIRTRAGLLGLSNFDDFVRNYFHLTSREGSQQEQVPSKGDITGSMPNLVLPLTRRLIWSDYKAHLEELIVNEPQKYPEILRAAKKLSEIDYKTRLLLYDVTAGGILTEKEPYIRLTELKRLLEM